MDLICPKCAEPWDNDCFHDEVEERRSLDADDKVDYRQVTREFYAEGCKALWAAFAGSTCNPATLGSQRAQIADALIDVMGDDTDGMASFMEDLDRGWL